MKADSRLIKCLMISLMFYGFYATFLVHFLNLGFVDGLDELLSVIGVIYIVYKDLSKGKITISKDRWLLIVFSCLGIISSFVTGINTKYCMVALFLSIKSYLIYYIFKKINWKQKDVVNILRIGKVSYVMLIFFGFLFYFIPKVSPFQTFGMSSICNHPAIFATLLVPLAIYYIVNIIEAGNSKLFYKLWVVVTCIVLAHTSKNIFSLGMATCIYILVSKKKRKYVFAVIMVVAFLIMLTQILAVVSNDYEAYVLSADSDTLPRIILLSTSVKIAEKYFPFGGGFGTFGSAISRTHYSPFYRIYKISSRYGMSETHGKYLTDSYWPSIIGETGFIGTVVLLLFLFCIIKEAVAGYKYLNNDEERRMGYVVILSFVALVIESLFTSTFFNLKCYLGIGMIGIYSSITRQRRDCENEKYNSV